MVSEDLEDLEDLDLAIDEDLFARTDQLLAAHRALARVDRSSAAATAVPWPRSRSSWRS